MQGDIELSEDDDTCIETDCKAREPIAGAREPITRVYSSKKEI